MGTRERLIAVRTDFNADPADMTGYEILEQLHYLESGQADTRNERGMRIGLSPALMARREELREVLDTAVRVSRAKCLESITFNLGLPPKT